MRRLPVAYAKPGMILDRPVYDCYGRQLLDRFDVITDANRYLLGSACVGEIVIRDSIGEGLIVAPLFPENLEAAVMTALYPILAGESGADPAVIAWGIGTVRPRVSQMVNHLLRMEIGDPDGAGCLSLEGYEFVHPVKAASLAIVTGHAAGLERDALIKLGMAAVLMDIGHSLMDRSIFLRPGVFSNPERDYVQQHARLSRQLLASAGLEEDVLAAIEQHHERWDGRGYPDGRRGGQVSPLAQVVSIAATYHALISARPYRPPYRPHEAAEFIVASSGEMFDPELTRFFVRSVPQYSAGMVVRLSTGEAAVVTSARNGHVARPVVRVIAHGHREVHPYDLDLSRMDCMNKLIAEVIG